MTCDYPEVRVNDDAAKADVESGIYTKHYQIKPTDTILDIGAHVGYFSMWAAPLCKKVIAFEPEPYNFKRLADNTWGFSNVICVESAVSSVQGMVTLHIDPQNSGGHGLFRELPDAVRVKSVHLGDYLNARRIKPDFAKIDAEGSEYLILHSLKEAGLRFPMAVEIHSSELFGMCSRLLELQGYKVIPEEPCVGVCYAMP